MVTYAGNTSYGVGSILGHAGQGRLDSERPLLRVVAVELMFYSFILGLLHSVCAIVFDQHLLSLALSSRLKLQDPASRILLVGMDKSNSMECLLSRINDTHLGVG